MRLVLLGRCRRIMASRKPDFVIGGADPYVRRWWVIPRNRLLNIYLHEFLRDDGRIPHDHPWVSCSIVLDGGYHEHLKGRVVWRAPGAVVFRRAVTAHRVELPKTNDVPLRAISLFIVGPRFRSWGFHCPSGWVHWREFTNPDDNGATVGRGCP